MPANLSVVNGRSASAMIGPGATAFKLISAASNNATLVGGAGKRVLYSVSVNNLNAAARYLKFYNKATAPAPATDVPVMVIPIAPAQPINLTYAAGIAFPLGLGIALVTGISDTDNTSVAASEHVVSLSYT